MFSFEIIVGPSFDELHEMFKFTETFEFSRFLGS